MRSTLGKADNRLQYRNLVEGIDKAFVDTRKRDAESFVHLGRGTEMVSVYQRGPAFEFSRLAEAKVWGAWEPNQLIS